MLEGDLVDQRYRLAEVLGRGGMGVVYRAVDERLTRMVAVKVLPPEEQRIAGARERFAREARRTAKLRHPNIVEVFDVGETPEGDLFFVMELLEGELLSKRIGRLGPLPLDVFGAIALPLCDALAAAHVGGVVHRDLKPENIMLARAGGDAAEQVKVLDFGIAKEVGSITRLTETGTFIGTVEYMSPEQIRGDTLDARADVYALGALFYRLLAGSPTFATENVATLIHKHLSVLPEPLRARAPAVPHAVEAVIMRCLAKEPQLRYASAAALRAALADALPLGAPLAGANPTVAARVPELDLQAPPRSTLGRTVPSAGLFAIVPQVEVEIELAPAPRPLPAAPLAPLVPVIPFAPRRELERVGTPPPRWLAPLGILPINLGKRVFAYSLLAAGVTRIFFGGGYLVSGGLLLLALASGVGLWVRHRAETA